MARKSGHASTTKIKSEQVCVQLPTSADNVTLPTFAANRHGVARAVALLLLLGARQPLPSIDISCPPAGAR